MTHEERTEFLELAPNIAEVVNLTVVDDPVAGLRIVHRLVTQRREIENSEPAVSKSDFEARANRILDQDGSGIIRAAMRKGLRAPFQHSLRNSRVMGSDAEDSAHSGVHRRTIVARQPQQRSTVRTNASVCGAGAVREIGSSVLPNVC